MNLFHKVQYNESLLHFTFSIRQTADAFQENCHFDTIEAIGNSFPEKYWVRCLNHIRHRAPVHNLQSIQMECRGQFHRSSHPKF